MLVIAATNILTQIFLKLALNTLLGMPILLFLYVFLEIIVFLLEAVLYRWSFPRLVGHTLSRRRTTVYSLAANAASFILGLGLALVLPGPY